MCERENEELPLAPAMTNKAKAIRKAYCLEKDEVFEFPEDNYTYLQKNGEEGEMYLCFDSEELDVVSIGEKTYVIKRIK